MAKKPKVYRMWALFNYDRPPIFVEMTRRECKVQGIDWVGGEKKYNALVRGGSITIKKVMVRIDTTVYKEES